MNPNLFIRIKGIDVAHDSEIGLAELGESLSGFDLLLKEFAGVLHLQGELEIKTTAIHEGSIIVNIIARLNEASAALSFQSIQDFLDFLKVTGDPIWKEAVSYFNTLEGAHKTINDWVSQRPLDTTLFSYLLAKAFKKLLEKAKKNKDKPDCSDAELPKRIAFELHKLIKRHAFNKAVKPIIEDKAKSIEVSTDSSFSSSVKIDHDNFQDYLAEDEQILPHLKNEGTYTLRGQITSLRGTRGDCLTFHMQDKQGVYNLNAVPAEGLTSKAYRNFYQETVEIEATVIRDSLYKKPKLKLHSIEMQQTELDLGDANKGC